MFITEYEGTLVFLLVQNCVKCFRHITIYPRNFYTHFCFFIIFTKIWKEESYWQVHFLACIPTGLKHNWAASWENQQNDCAPNEDSDQPGHPPSLIRVFVVCMKKAWVLSYPLSAQRRLWSDWADAQVDLSLRWAHSHFVGFVMKRLIFKCNLSYILFKVKNYNYKGWVCSLMVMI